MDRIKDIKDRLRQIKALDKNYSVFGANRHKYEFRSKLSQKEIENFENKNKITLSEEYKSILQNLGNGGAGCGYGLESLSNKNLNPPYPGTNFLLRNCKNPETIREDMVDIGEISGYIKLFDYGCGIETCLIVSGDEKGDLIFFDCDGRFEKITDKALFDLYDNWLNDNLKILERVENKLNTLDLQEVIDSEWALKNFSIEAMILSIIGAEPLIGEHSGNQLASHLENEHSKWLKSKSEQKKRRWKIFKN